MSNRNPKVQELEQLYGIKESDAFQEYLKLLTSAYDGVYANLAHRLVTPEHIADHNYKIGMLEGINKARSHIDAIIKELERELKLEQLNQEIKSAPRKVTHQ